MNNTYHPSYQSPQHLPHGQNKLHPLVVEILKRRGVNESMLNEFFSDSLKDLPDLTSMIDCNKAALRIAEAINKNEKLAIYGDYDVDGTTSCALFYHFFKMLNINIGLYQPSRFIEGYGLHPSLIEKSITDGTKVLITVDCGITNTEAAEYAKERDLDLIITDHHKDACEQMPNAYAIVNPNRRDEPADSPLGPLAGVAVAFAVCWEVKKVLEQNNRTIPSLYPLLQFVAIGTICDLATLTTINRRLVIHGLRQIQTTQYEGLKPLFPKEERESGFISSDRLSFNVGPMINSKGRLEHAEAALNLLIADENQQAFQLCNQLEICNNERKRIQKQVYEEAQKLVLDENLSGQINSAIVYKKDWHEGVIGIVASKLVETFHVPAVVFSDADKEGIIKASARSAGELNLFEILKKLEHYTLKFGGHKAAAGLSMKRENLTDFKKDFNNLLLMEPEILRTQQENIDMELSLADITPKLVKELEKLEPFGMGNPRPKFKIYGLKLDSYKLLKDIHVSWFFKDKDTKTNSPSIRGISFNYIGKWATLHPREVFDRQRDEDFTINATLNINRFRGNETIQLMVDSINF